MSLPLKHPARLFLKLGARADLKVSDPRSLNNKVLHKIPSVMCAMRLCLGRPS